MAVFVALTVWPLADATWRYFRYDDSPAVTFIDMRMLTPSAKAGGVMQYVTQYNKRAECHPPRGHGEVSYRLYGSPDGTDGTRHLIIDFDMRRQTRWDPGMNQTFRSSVPVPQDVPPGHYSFETISTYTCERGSAPQTIRSPPLKVQIVN